MHFCIGSTANGGIYGNHPSLADDDLYRGDIVYETDYRHFYASLAGFLGLDPTLALGETFTPMDFIAQNEV